MRIKLIYFILLIFSSHISWASTIYERAVHIENEVYKAVNNPQKSEAILKNLDMTINSWSALENSHTDLTQNAEKTLALLFKIKTKLRTIPVEELNQQYQQQDLEQILRKALNSVRYLEDFISESVFANISTHSNRMLPFEGQLGFNQNKDNNSFSIDSLKSGDIILIRGNSALSSSIARISQSPSVNSHLAIVYKNERTNEKFLIESMSHSGVVINELSKAFSEPLARVSVYRHFNQDIGTKAAQFALDAARASQAEGKMLKFDFSFDMTYNCRFFCSKFVSWVYDKSSDGQITIPQYQSHLNRSNNTFKERIGIKPQIAYSFLPSDIDIDNRFELINEYRNPNMTPEVRLDDFITDKVFEWIDKENLDFNPNLRLKIISKLLVKTVQNKFLHNLLKKVKINLNPETPAELITTMAIMKSTIEKIKSKIHSDFKSSYHSHVKKMSSMEIYNLVEMTRKENPKLLKHFQKKSISLPNSCLVFYGRS